MKPREYTRKIDRNRLGFILPMQFYRRLSNESAVYTVSYPNQIFIFDSATMKNLLAILKKDRIKKSLQEKLTCDVMSHAEQEFLAKTIDFLSVGFNQEYLMKCFGFPGIFYQIINQPDISRGKLILDEMSMRISGIRDNNKIKIICHEEFIELRKILPGNYLVK